MIMAKKVKVITRFYNFLFYLLISLCKCTLNWHGARLDFIQSKQSSLALCARVIALEYK